MMPPLCCVVEYCAVGSLLSINFQDVHVVVDLISFVTSVSQSVSAEFKYVIGSNPVAQ